MSLKSSPTSSLLHDVYLAVIPWFKAMLTEVPEDVAAAVKAIDSAVMAAVPHCHYCADLSIVRSVDRLMPLLLSDLSPADFRACRAFIDDQRAPPHTQCTIYET